VEKRGKRVEKPVDAQNALLTSTLQWGMKSGNLGEVWHMFGLKKAISLGGSNVLGSLKT